MKVYDLRGLDLSDPLRKEAYPREPIIFGEPMRYIHLLSTRWYFDASEERNASEADRVIGDLCFAAETGQFYSDGYRPLHVVVDNFGGTVVGELEKFRDEQRIAEFHERFPEHGKGQA